MVNRMKITSVTTRPCFDSPPCGVARAMVMQTSLTREKGTHQNQLGQQDKLPTESGAFFQSNNRGERLSMRLLARAGQARHPAQVLAAVRSMRAIPLLRRVPPCRSSPRPVILPAGVRLGPVAGL